MTTKRTEHTESLYDCVLFFILIPMFLVFRNFYTVEVWAKSDADEVMQLSAIRWRHGAQSTPSPGLSCNNLRTIHMHQPTLRTPWSPQKYCLNHCARTCCSLRIVTRCRFMNWPIRCERGGRNGVRSVAPAQLSMMGMILTPEPPALLLYIIQYWRWDLMYQADNVLRTIFRTRGWPGELSPSSDRNIIFNENNDCNIF